MDKAGKTTLLERLKSMYGTTPGTPPERILPTVGLNVGRMQVRVGSAGAAAQPRPGCIPRFRLLSAPRLQYLDNCSLSAQL